jgi:phage-related protein
MEEFGPDLAKKSAKTPPRELSPARRRLKEVAT